MPSTILVSPDSIAILLFFAILNERLIEYFASPIFVARAWNTKWLMYVGLVTGFVLGLVLIPQLFVDGLFISPIVGRVITGVLVGGGSNLLHQITVRKD